MGIISMGGGFFFLLQNLQSIQDDAVRISPFFDRFGAWAGLGWGNV